MMIIVDYIYDDGVEKLIIDFSMPGDYGCYYHKLELDYYQIEYYSPDIIAKEDLENITTDFIIDLVDEYLKENDLPELFPL